jgi:hypothetical protein
MDALDELLTFLRREQLLAFEGKCDATLRPANENAERARKQALVKLIAHLKSHRRAAVALTLIH